MALKTNGVGTPGDENFYVKKDKLRVETKKDLGVIKKFKLNAEIAKQFNRVNGEVMTVTHSLTKVNFDFKNASKQLEQDLKAGVITQEQYNKMKSMLEKLKNK